MPMWKVIALVAFGAVLVALGVTLTVSGMRGRRGRSARVDSHKLPLTTAARHFAADRRRDGNSTNAPSHWRAEE
jgi:hypothetical protein